MNSKELVKRTGFYFPLSNTDNRIDGQVIEVGGREYIAQDSGMEIYISRLDGQKIVYSDDQGIIIKTGCILDEDIPELIRKVEKAGMSQV